MKPIHRALSLLVLASCSAGPNVAHSRYDAVHNALVTLGMGAAGRLAEGSLPQGATARFPADLDTQCYTFVALGSDGARDIDVAVLDPQGQPVAADTTHEPQATTQFCASDPGRYTITVRMAQGHGGYLLSSWRGPRGAAPPASSTCDAPRPLRLAQTVTGETSRGGHEQSPGCVENAANAVAPEIVYALQIDRRMLVTARLESDYDGVVYIRRNNCEDPEAEVACNDDAAQGDTRHSRVSLAMDPGRYYVFVDGYGAEHGNYSLTVTGADVPSPQELCQNATALPPGQAVLGDTSNDIDSFEARCANRATGPDHAYRLIVPQESRAQITQETPDYDGALYIRRACAEATSEVACNDDADDTQHSRINTVLQAGTYFVFTDAYNPARGGRFTLEADLAPIGGASTPGDGCTDAQALTLGQPVEGNTFSARDDVVTTCGAQTEGYDLVYQFSVRSRSRVQFWFDQADLAENVVIELARACGPNAGAGAAVGCRAGAIGATNALDQVVDPGTYYVIVDAARERLFGRFRLQSRVQDLVALERTCRAATLLHNGSHVTGTTQGDDRFWSQVSEHCPRADAHGPENLYRLVLTRRSFVRLGVSATSQGFDPIVYLRSNCTDPSTQRACDDDVSPRDSNALIEATLDPGTYTVFVDGFGNSHGTYSLEAVVTPQ